MGINTLEIQANEDCVEPWAEFKQLISCLLMLHVDIANWHMALTKK